LGRRSPLPTASEHGSLFRVVVAWNVPASLRLLFGSAILVRLS
jgi:hypothetical protein